MGKRSKTHARLPLAGLLLGLLPSLLLLAGCSEQSTVSHQQILGVDHYVDGALAYEHGDTDRAQAELSDAVKENPELTMAHVMLGDIYRSKSDYRHASDHYEAAVRLDPYEWKNHYDLGIAYQFLNRLQEAAACYIRALKLQPRDINATMNLGLVYLALNQPADALRMMNRAIELDPKNASAHCNLGVVLESRGDLYQSEFQYHRALELDPQSSVALLDLGNNLIHQRRGRDAAQVMQAVLKKSDTFVARKLYGDALVLSGRDDDAYRQYVDAVSRNPRYWQALNQAAMILIRKYQTGTTLDENLRRQAVAVWRKSLEIHPDQPAIQALADKWDQGGKVLP